MAEEFSPGDVVAVALASAAIGGFMVAGGVGLAIQGWERMASEPISSLVGALFLAFVGTFIGLVIAGPVGVAVGLAMRRFFGGGRRVAFSSGALTAFLIFAIAYRDEGFDDPWILLIGIIFISIGALLAYFFHWYVTEKTGKFPPSIT